MALEKPYGKPITFHPYDPDQLRGELVDSILALTAEEKAYCSEMIATVAVKASTGLDETIDNTAA